MFIADLHIHSRYSRATSRECTPEHLDLWARRKGISLLGSGDFTHPQWRKELEEKLAPAQEGLYVLKEEFRIKDGTVEGRYEAGGVGSEGSGSQVCHLRGDQFYLQEKRKSAEST